MNPRLRALRFLLIGGTVGGLVLVLRAGSVLAGCTERNQQACSDQSGYAALMGLAEMLWEFNRMLLMLARLMEIFQDWILSVAQELLDPLIASIRAPFWFAVAVAMVFFAIGFFARPLMNFDLVDMRHGAIYFIGCMIVFGLGGPMLAAAEELRVSGGQFIARFTAQVIDDTAGDIVPTIDPAEADTLLITQPITPLYQSALCPPAAAFEEFDTGSWDLSRDPPDQTFVSDYAAAFVFADYQDIWCPEVVATRPELPQRFAGTASVAEGTEYYAFSEVDGGAFSIVGPPTVALSTMQEVVCAIRHGAVPPACEEVDDIYQTLVNANIDPAVWLVFAAKETEFGSTGPGRPPGAGDYNLHNIRCNDWDGGGCNDKWAVGSFSAYNSYRHAVASWVELMCCRGIYIDAGNVTPRDIISVYAPASENDTEQYIQQYKAWITAWREQDSGRASYQPTTPNPNPNPAPAPDEGGDHFAGYFPFPSIDHLSDGRRMRLLSEASNGVGRMGMALILAVAGVLEQTIHIIYSAALVISWIALVLMTLFAPFTPTRHHFTSAIKNIFQVIKASWIASVWVAMVLVLLQFASDNAMALTGFGMIGIVVLGWQIWHALIIFFQGVMGDTWKDVAHVAKMAVAAATGGTTMLVLNGVELVKRKNQQGGQG